MTAGKKKARSSGATPERVAETRYTDRDSPYLWENSITSGRGRQAIELSRWRGGGCSGGE